MKPISPWFQTATLLTQSVMRSAIWRPNGGIDRPTCSRSVRIATAHSVAVQKQKGP